MTEIDEIRARLRMRPELNPLFNFETMPFYWVASQYRVEQRGSNSTRWHCHLFYGRDSAIEYLDSLDDPAMNDIDRMLQVKYNIPGY